jgi:hypothetical protein
VSYPISFNPLSLADVFRLRGIKAYEYEGDVVLTVDNGDQSCLLHLYENEVDGDTMYGLSLGRAAALTGQPFFVGDPSAVEVLLFKSETAWDFQSLLLKDGIGSSLRVGRNDASFPEPTFSVIRQSDAKAR